MKKRMSITAVKCRKAISNKPMEARISIKPVKKTTSFLKEMNPGSIIVMPLLNTKWPMAVTNNIVLIAALPANTQFQL